MCKLQLSRGSVFSQPAWALPLCQLTTTAAVARHSVQHSTYGNSQSRRQQQQPCGLSGLQQQQPDRGQLLKRQAGPIDAAPTWTLDQIAGLAFGVVMLAFYFGSKEVDVFIAKRQRQQLGLCERCGGLNDPSSCTEGGCPMKSKAL